MFQWQPELYLFDDEVVWELSFATTYYYCMNAVASTPPYMHSGVVYPTNGNPEIRLTHPESPLDTLARRTSSRKLPAHQHKVRQQTQKPLIWEPYRPHGQQQNALASQQKPTNLHLQIDRTRPPVSTDTLHSPLLHSLFPSRDSVLSRASGYDSFDVSQSEFLPYDNVNDDPRLSPPNLQSGSSGNAHDRSRSDLNKPLVSRASEIRHSDFLDYYLDRPDDVPDLPTVIVSSPDNSPSDLHGRAPVIKPVMANFSRPMRDSGQWRRADAIAEWVTPQLPPQMRDQKKAVLERNATRQTAIAANSDYKPSPLSIDMTANRPPQSGHKALAINSAVGFAVAQPAVAQSSPYITSIPPSNSSTLQPHSGSELRAVSPDSPSSLYSNYSYYQYDGLIPSPILLGPSNPDRATTPSMVLSPADNRTSLINESQTPQKAQDFLLLGIEHHEANRLQESVRCFERSAKEGGGCGVGMLMYGLSLRHGWGCPKNEALGFKWVRKAAESAVEDLEQLRIGKANLDKGSIQAELVLAIYEVGQCFFHGWGVAKDQKMGFSYYMVAARLGDGDAQGDLAFCLANGKGCKKNKKEAARWYRAAIQQGQSDVGLAWIYKDKYQD